MHITFAQPSSACVLVRCPVKKAGWQPATPSLVSSSYLSLWWSFGTSICRAWVWKSVLPLHHSIMTVPPTMQGAVYAADVAFVLLSSFLTALCLTPTKLNFHKPTTYPSSRSPNGGGGHVFPRLPNTTTKSKPHTYPSSRWPNGWRMWWSCNPTSSWLHAPARAMSVHARRSWGRSTQRAMVPRCGEERGQSAQQVVIIIYNYKE